MPLPTRIQAITPFQQYLQDMMLADVGGGGMMTLLAPEGVYVNGYPRLEGGVPPARPNVLISTATELGMFPSFFRVANSNTQQIDIFTDEVASTAKLGAVYNRILFLFDNKMPVIPGFVAHRATRVEWTGHFPDSDGRSTHGICVVLPQLRVA